MASMRGRGSTEGVGAGARSSVLLGETVWTAKSRLLLCVCGGSGVGGVEGTLTTDFMHH